MEEWHRRLNIVDDNSEGENMNENKAEEYAFNEGKNEDESTQALAPAAARRG